MLFRNLLFSQKGEVSVVYALVCGISTLCLLISSIGTGVYVEDVNSLVRTSCMTLSKNEGQYVCCFENQCRCLEAPFGTPSCSGLISSKTEGTCDSGSRCCRWATNRYRCGETCKTDMQGVETCTPKYCEDQYCALRVSHEQCEVYCTNCYSPSVRLSYLARETVTSPQKTYEMTLSKSCGTSVFCKNSYLNEFAGVEDVQVCFYDQDDVYEVHFDDDYEPYWFVFLGVSSCAWISSGCCGVYLYQDEIKEQGREFLRRLTDCQGGSDQEEAAAVELRNRVRRCSVRINQRARQVDIQNPLPSIIDEKAYDASDESEDLELSKRREDGSSEKQLEEGNYIFAPSAPELEE